MAILYGYLKSYWKLVVAALVLAAVNQVFSLLDPLIFRHIIDSYATTPGTLAQSAGTGKRGKGGVVISWVHS